MRICIVLPAHWEAIMGGSQYQAKLLLETLVAEGHEVYYLARSIKKEFAPQGYQIVGLRGLRFSRVFDSYDLYRQLKKINPDVIYQRVGCAYTAVCAYFADNHNKRMVWHLASDMDVGRGVGNSRNPLNHLEELMISYARKHAQTIVAQTEDQAMQFEHITQRKVAAIIPNFQPAPEIANSHVKNSETTLIWIGNLKPVKQPQIFVQLAADLADITTLKFIMVGRPYPDQTKQDQIEKNMAQIANLEYLGGKTLEEVNGLLLQADLLVNTSSVEGFSNTFIQAWMRGVPVVSLSVNPDGLLDDPQIGRTAHNHYDEFKALVRSLAEDKATRSEMSANVRSYALKKHSLDNIDQLKAMLTDSVAR